MPVFQNFFPKNVASLGTKLEMNRGFGPGFDFCRIALALSIIVFHSFTTLGQGKMENTELLWILNVSVLPMFFGLSGFLVAGSAQRLNLQNFLINRGIRIVPALSVEILLSALILGPLLTSVALSQYFTDGEFFRYFLNMLGIVHYELPGMFESNPNNIVNASLWTVPLEIACYALISILIFTKSLHRWWFVVAMGVAWTAAGYLYNRFDLGATTFIAQVEMAKTLLTGAFAQRGPGLIPCFLFGILVYNYRDKIPYSGVLALFSLAALAAIGGAGSFGWVQSPLFVAVTTPLFVYLIVYVGLSRMPKVPFYHRGDYSYGIYLYGYPLQQTIVQFFPEINIFAHIAASIIGVTIFATFSWHCIEKPILAMRKNFAFTSRRKEENAEEKREALEPILKKQNEMVAANINRKADQSVDQAQKSLPSAK